MVIEICSQFWLHITDRILHIYDNAFIVNCLITLLVSGRLLLIYSCKALARISLFFLLCYVHTLHVHYDSVHRSRQSFELCASTDGYQQPVAPLIKQTRTHKWTDMKRWKIKNSAWCNIWHALWRLSKQAYARATVFLLNPFSFAFIITNINAYLFVLLSL